MQNEHGLVNDVARELFVRVNAERMVRGGASPSEARDVARSAYAIAKVFAEVAKTQPGNEQAFQSMVL